MSHSVDGTVTMIESLRVLCLNSGSSSLKFALFDMGDSEAQLAWGAVECIGAAPARIWTRTADSRDSVRAEADIPDARRALEAAFRALGIPGRSLPAAVGHRIVHGGPDHDAPEWIDAPLVATLRRLIPMAPLHLPPVLDCIEAVATQFPGLPQVACFDTAFHRRMPELAQRLPLPRPLWDAGIRRYGFHGLSYEYVVEQLGAAGLGRLIIAHLGNGASMVAVRDGRPLDTTMGFTPAGGFMMGTRSGDLDPGVLLYLQSAMGYDIEALDHLVNHESGLRGVSGGSSDMKTLLAQRGTDPGAALAVELFCHHLRKNIGALAAVLGGVDTLVFTGGIGERAAAVREEACRGLAHLGIRIDVERNAQNESVISDATGTCTVRVVATDEDLMIARHTRRLLAAGAKGREAGMTAPGG